MTKTDLQTIVRDLGYKFTNGTKDKDELVEKILELQCSPSETPIEMLMRRLWNMHDKVLSLEMENKNLKARNHYLNILLDV